MAFSRSTAAAVAVAMALVLAVSLADGTAAQSCERLREKCVNSGDVAACHRCVDKCDDADAKVCAEQDAIIHCLDAETACKKDHGRCGDCIETCNEVGNALGGSVGDLMHARADKCVRRYNDGGDNGGGSGGGDSQELLHTCFASAEACHDGYVRECNPCAATCDTVLEKYSHKLTADEVSAVQDASNYCHAHM